MKVIGFHTAFSMGRLNHECLKTCLWKICSKDFLNLGISTDYSFNSYAYVVYHILYIVLSLVKRMQVYKMISTLEGSGSKGEAKDAKYNK